MQTNHRINNLFDLDISFSKSYEVKCPKVLIDSTSGRDQESTCMPRFLQTHSFINIDILISRSSIYGKIKIKMENSKHKKMMESIGGWRNILQKQSFYQFNTVRYARNKPLSKFAPPSIEKRLDCVMLGLPNAGKSVLMNALVKHKIAATSRKRQTTRGEITGVFNHRNTQLVFFDTPGYISSVSALRREADILRKTATESVEKADVVLLVVDAARVFNDNGRYIFGEMVSIALKKAKKEVILVLNKVDLVNPKKKLLDLTFDLVSLINGVKLGPEKAHLAKADTTTFMISALHDDGVLDLKNYLIRIADKKPWLLSREEGFTTLSVEERVQEILLEKILDQLHEEIPYNVRLDCTNVSLEDENTVRVDVDIYVRNVRHKKIVIGSNARSIVSLRQDLCTELEKIFKKNVMARLEVKMEKEGHGDYNDEEDDDDRDFA